MLDHKSISRTLRNQRLNNKNKSFSQHEEPIKIKESSFQRSPTLQLNQLPENSQTVISKQTMKSKEKIKPKQFCLFKKSKSKPNFTNSTNDDDTNASINESDNSPDNLFQIGKSYIEGKNDLPVDIEKEINSLEKSIKGGNIDAVVYYCRMLIKGDIIIQSLSKAEKILKKLLKEKMLLFIYYTLK